MSTPKPSNNPVAVSPPVIYSPRIGFRGKSKRKKRGLGCGFVLMRLVLGLSLVFLAESGFSWAVFRVLKPGLSPEIVRNFGEKSWVLEGVHEKVEFLHREIKSLVNGNTEDCSSDESLWKINRVVCVPFTIPTPCFVFCLILWGFFVFTAPLDGGVREKIKERELWFLVKSLIGIEHFSDKWREEYKK